MKASQRVVQVCLFLVAAIAMFGGTVQMVLGHPDTTPRLDNVRLGSLIPELVLPVVIVLAQLSASRLASQPHRAPAS